MAFNLTANLNVAVNTGALKAAANQINSTLGGVNNIKIGTNAATFASIRPLKAQITESTDAIENFGKQAGFAAKRFAAFSVTAGAIIGFTQTIKSAISSAIDFDREMVRLSQVSNDSVQDVASVGQEITRLSTGLGVSSQDLVKVAVTLKQANLSLKDTKIALEAMAQAALAPNFDNLKDTTEGAIAIMNQFKISASGLSGALGAVNVVAGEFAVEAGDIIEAVRKTGGAFKAAGGNLNELIALFTAVRQTTRESAESIGTGLRTIFTRIQRNDTAAALKEVGINLRYTRDEAIALGDAGLTEQFVGPYEAVKRLSEGLNQLRSTDPRFSAIVEQLGGYRQISKVIPLIQEFGTAQKALGIAQAGSVSLALNAGQAQDALAVKLQKLKETFLDVGRNIVNSPGFKSLVDIFISGSTAALRLLDSLKGLIPVLAAIAAVKIGQGLVSFGTGFIKGAAGDAKTNKKADGGFLRMRTGGIVPGSGSGDKVPALLEPGEMVIPKKYASGGTIKSIKDKTKKVMLSRLYDTKPDLDEYKINGIKRIPLSTPYEQNRVNAEEILNSAKNVYQNSRKSKVSAKQSTILANEELDKGFKSKGATRGDLGFLKKKNFKTKIGEGSNSQYNQIAGRLGESDTERQMASEGSKFERLPSKKGLDFIKDGNIGVETKTTQSQVLDEEIIAKALLNKGHGKGYKNKEPNTIDLGNLQVYESYIGQKRANGGPIYRQRFMNGKNVGPQPFPKGLYAEEILGFTKGYKPQGPELTSAFRRAALIHHPDRGGLPENMAQVNSAFQRLKDRNDLKSARSQSGPKTTNNTRRNTPPPPKTGNASTEYRDREKAWESIWGFANGGDVVRQKFASGKFVAKDTEMEEERKRTVRVRAQEVRRHWNLNQRDTGYQFHSRPPIRGTYAADTKHDELIEEEENREIANRNGRRNNLGGGLLSGGLMGAASGALLGGVPGAVIGGVMGAFAGVRVGIKKEGKRQEDYGKNRGLATFTYEDGHEGGTSRTYARNAEEAEERAEIRAEINGEKIGGVKNINRIPFSEDRTWGEYAKGIFGGKKAAAKLGLTAFTGTGFGLMGTGIGAIAGGPPGAFLGGVLGTTAGTGLGFLMGKYAESQGRTSPLIEEERAKHSQTERGRKKKREEPEKETKNYTGDIYKPLPALEMNPELGKSRLFTKEMFAENKKRRGFASGGLVPGTGNSDTVPMDLDEGSFVIKKSSTNKIGAQNLANAHKFESGGKVPSLLTPGEYVYSPSEAKKIGASKLHQMNSYGQLKKLAAGGPPGKKPPLISDVYLSDKDNITKLENALIKQIMSRDPQKSESTARTEATNTINNIKIQNQIYNKSVGDIANADKDISTEKSNIGLFNTDLKGLRGTLSQVGKEAITLGNSLSKNAQEATNLSDAETSLTAKIAQAEAQRQAKVTAGPDLTQENKRIVSAQQKLDDLNQKKRDMGQERQKKIDAADQKLAAAEEAKRLKSQQPVDIRPNVKRLENIKGTLNILRAQREDKLDKGQSTDVIDARIEEQKRKRAVATKELSDKVAAGPDTKKEQAAIDRAKAEQSEANKPLKSRGIDTKILRADDALKTAEAARANKKVDTSREDAQLLKLNAQLAELEQKKIKNAQDKVTIDSSINANATKTQNVEAAILQTDNAILAAKQRIATAEAAKAAAKAEGDKASSSFMRDAKGRVVDENGRVIGKKTSDAGTLKESIREEQKRTGATGKDAKALVAQKMTEDYQEKVFKQLRSDAVGKKEEFDPDLARAKAADMARSSARGRATVEKDAKGNIIGDQRLADTLVGDGRNASGKLGFFERAPKEKKTKEQKQEESAQRAANITSGIQTTSLMVAGAGAYIASGQKENVGSAESLFSQKQGLGTLFEQDMARTEEFKSAYGNAGRLEKGTSYAAAGASAGAGIGGAIGLLGGPLGAAGGALAGAGIGAAVGAITGILKGGADGLKEADAAIRQVKIGNALSTLQSVFERVSNGLMEINDSTINTIRASQEELSKQGGSEAFAKSGGEKGGFDLLFEGSFSKSLSAFGGNKSAGFNVNEFNSQIAKNQQQDLAKQLVPLTNLLNKQAETLGKNSFNQAFQANPQAAQNLNFNDIKKDLVEQFKSGNGGFNKEQMTNVARARNISVEDVQKEMLKVIEESFKASKLAKAQQEATIAVESNMNSLALLSNAFQAAALSVHSYSTALASNSGLFENRIQGSKLSSLSENFSVSSTPDIAAFNDSLKQLSSGIGGKAGADFQAQGSALNAASQLLPSILASANANPLGGGDVASEISNALLEGLKAQGIVGEQASKIANSVGGNISGQEYTKFLAESGGDVSKATEKLLANIKDPFLNAAKQISQNLENAGNEFTNGLVELANRQKQINSEIDRVNQLKLQKDKFQAGLKAEAAGRPSTASDYLSIQQELRPTEEKQRKLTGLNADAFSPEAVAAKLEQTQAKVQEKEKQIQKVDRGANGGETFRAASVELIKLKSEASNLTDALKGLADQSTKLSVLQDRLSKLEEKRQQSLTIGRKLVTGGQEERVKFAQGQQLFNVAKSQNFDIRNFNDAQGKAIFEFLDNFGQGGKEIQDKILENLGFGLDKGQKTEKADLNTQIAKTLNDQITAQQEVVANQKNLQTDYFSNLDAQNKVFYANLEKFTNQMEKTSLENKKAREIQALTKIQNVQEKSGFLTAAGVDSPEKLKFVKENRGLITDQLKLNKDKEASTKQQAIISTYKPEDSGMFKEITDLISGETGVLQSKEVGQNAGAIERKLMDQFNIGPEIAQLIRSQLSTNLSKFGNKPISEANFKDIFKSALGTGSTQIGTNLSKRQEDIDKRVGDNPLIKSIIKEAEARQMSVESFDSALNSVLELNKGIGDGLTNAANTAKATIDALNVNIANIGNGIPQVPPPQPANVVGAATGGAIFSPRGTDTVPAMLTPGEFVVNKSATQQNLPLLKSINSGKTSYLSNGGPVLYAGGGREVQQQALSARIVADEKLKKQFQNEIDDPFTKELLSEFDKDPIKAPEIVKNKITDKYRAVEAAVNDPAIMAKILNNRDFTDPKAKKVEQVATPLLPIFKNINSKDITIGSTEDKKQKLVDNVPKINEKAAKFKSYDYNNFKADEKQIIMSEYGKYKKALPPNYELKPEGWTGAVVSHGLGAITATGAGLLSAPSGPASILSAGAGYTTGYGIGLYLTKSSPQDAADYYENDIITGKVTNVPNAIAYYNNIGLMGNKNPVMGFEPDLEKYPLDTNETVKAKIADQKRLMGVFNLQFKEANSHINQVLGGDRSIGSNSERQRKNMGNNASLMTSYYNDLFAGIVGIDRSKPEFEEQDLKRYMLTPPPPPSPQDYDYYEPYSANVGGLQNIKGYQFKLSLNKQVPPDPQALAANEAAISAAIDLYIQDLQDKREALKAVPDQAAVAQIAPQVDPETERFQGLLGRGNLDEINAAITAQQAFGGAGDPRKLAQLRLKKQLLERGRTAVRGRSGRLTGASSFAQQYNTESQKVSNMKFSDVNAPTDAEKTAFFKSEGNAKDLALTQLKGEFKAKALLGKLQVNEGQFAAMKREAKGDENLVYRQLIPFGEQAYNGILKNQASNIPEVNYLNEQKNPAANRNTIESSVKMYSFRKAMMSNAAQLLDLDNRYKGMAADGRFAEAAASPEGAMGLNKVPSVYNARAHGEYEAYMLLRNKLAQFGVRDVGRFAQRGIQNTTAVSDRLEQAEGRKAGEKLKKIKGWYSFKGEKSIFGEDKGASLNINGKDVVIDEVANNFSSSAPIGKRRVEGTNKRVDLENLFPVNAQITALEVQDKIGILAGAPDEKSKKESKNLNDIYTKLVKIKENFLNKQQVTYDSGNVDSYTYLNQMENEQRLTDGGRYGKTFSYFDNEDRFTGPNQNNDEGSIFSKNDFIKRVLIPKGGNAYIESTPAIKTENKNGIEIQSEFYKRKATKITHEKSDDLKKMMENSESFKNLDNESKDLIEKIKNLMQLEQVVQPAPAAQANAKGGMINYLANGGVPSYAPNPDPSYFKPMGTDTVPAMLTPGEFVVNASASAKHEGLLSAINSGQNVGYSATGGMVKYLSEGTNKLTKADKELKEKYNLTDLKIPEDFQFEGYEKHLDAIRPNRKTGKEARPDEDITDVNDVKYTIADIRLEFERAVSDLAYVNAESRKLSKNESIAQDVVGRLTYSKDTLQDISNPAASLKQITEDANKFDYEDEFFHELKRVTPRYPFSYGNEIDLSVSNDIKAGDIGLRDAWLEIGGSYGPVKNPILGKFEAMSIANQIKLRQEQQDENERNKKRNFIELPQQNLLEENFQNREAEGRLYNPRDKEFKSPIGGQELTLPQDSANNLSRSLNANEFAHKSGFGGLKFRGMTNQKESEALINLIKQAREQKKQALAQNIENIKKKVNAQIAAESSTKVEIPVVGIDAQLAKSNENLYARIKNPKLPNDKLPFPVEGLEGKFTPEAEAKPITRPTIAMQEAQEAKNIKTNQQVKLNKENRKGKEDNLKEDLIKENKRHGDPKNLTDAREIIAFKKTQIRDGNTDPIANRLHTQIAKTIAYQKDSNSDINDPAIYNPYLQEVDTSRENFGNVKTESSRALKIYSDTNIADLNPAIMVLQEYYDSVIARRFGFEEPREVQKKNELLAAKMDREAVMLIAKKAKGVIKAENQNINNIGNDEIKNPELKALAENTFFELNKNARDYYVELTKKSPISQLDKNKLLSSTVADEKLKLPDNLDRDLSGLFNPQQISINGLDPSTTENEKRRWERVDKKANIYYDEYQSLNKSLALVFKKSGNIAFSQPLFTQADNQAKQLMGFLQNDTARNIAGPSFFNTGGNVPSYAFNSNPSYFKPMGTDTVPAMLTPGEFVVNASATAKHSDLLNSINSGQDVSALALGGKVSYLYGGGYAQSTAMKDANSKGIDKGSLGDGIMAGFAQEHIQEKNQANFYYQNSGMATYAETGFGQDAAKSINIAQGDLTGANSATSSGVSSVYDAIKQGGGPGQAFGEISYSNQKFNQAVREAKIANKQMKQFEAMAEDARKQQEEWDALPEDEKQKIMAKRNADSILTNAARNSANVGQYNDGGYGSELNLMKQRDHIWGTKNYDKYENSQVANLFRNNHGRNTNYGVRANYGKQMAHLKKRSGPYEKAKYGLFSKGGIAHLQFGGGVDSQPAMLSEGEFVVNKDSAQKHSGLLNYINKGKEVKKYSKGGGVGMSYFNDGGGVNAKSNNVYVSDAAAQMSSASSRNATAANIFSVASNNTLQSAEKFVSTGSLFASFGLSIENSSQKLNDILSSFNENISSFSESINEFVSGISDSFTSINESLKNNFNNFNSSVVSFSITVDQFLNGIKNMKVKHEHVHTFNDLNVNVKLDDNGIINSEKLKQFVLNLIAQDQGGL